MRRASTGTAKSVFTALTHVPLIGYNCTLKEVHPQVAEMPANSARIANPFVYGRVLGSQDAACPRPTYELAIEEAIANRGRLALVGDRRLGKSTLVEKVGSHFRVRNRFLRLWLCTQEILIQELIPQLREEGQYRASIARVCPQLSFD
jgi:hypothetical protein